MTAILADLVEIKADVAKHDAIINGNGQPGIKTRVALLEEAAARTTSLLYWVIGLLVSMLLSGGAVTVWFITAVLPELYKHLGAP